eukprot:2166911-Alexandrium_andersonii.AAC.1
MTVPARCRAHAAGCSFHRRRALGLFTRLCARPHANPTPPLHPRIKACEKPNGNAWHAPPL